MKYLHLSIFGGHEKRHGGTRRSEQLQELLCGADGVSVNPYLGLESSLLLGLRHPLTFLRALVFSAYLYATRGLSFRGFLQYAAYSVNLMKVLERHEFDVVLHETAPGISISFMRYLAWRGIDYIAIPHNIEYLVPGQAMKAFRANHRVYQAEVEGYRAARQVLAICDFDTAILRCSGVDAHTLEYRPIRRDRAWFELIRARRAARTDFDGFLLLGTVENPPTFNGVKALLDTLRVTHPELLLTVAGYGTEAFRDYQSDAVTVLGSVSEAQVESLLSGATALLINQPQTTGFLTKIVEMNLCGVPQVVISNYFQAEGMSRFGIVKAQVESLHEIDIPAHFDPFPEPADDNLLVSLLAAHPAR